MKKYIAFLRGINVSGQKKVPMAELREILSYEGLQNVKTYIQSGNVVFEHSVTSPEKLEKLIQKTIQDHFGFEVKTFVTTLEYINMLLATDPYPEQSEKEGNRVFVTMLSEIPDPQRKAAIEALEFPDEHFQFGEKEVFFYFPNGGGRAKMNNNFLERKLKLDATTRNWKTLKAIKDLCE